VKDLNLRPTD